MSSAGSKTPRLARADGAARAADPLPLVGDGVERYQSPRWLTLMAGMALFRVRLTSVGLIPVGLTIPVTPPGIPAPLRIAPVELGSCPTIAPPVARDSEPASAAACCSCSLVIAWAWSTVGAIGRLAHR